MEAEKRRVLEAAVKELTDFKRIFGRDLTPFYLGEMYVALQLNLSPVVRPNEPGSTSCRVTGSGTKSSYGRPLL
jgi:hypothetical protein